MSKNNSKEKNKTAVAKKEIKGKRSREDIKAPKINVLENDTQWDLFHTIAFWGLAVLLFLPPYFRGLFFAPEQERALIFTAVVFWFAWLWKWCKRDYNFLSHPMDYFVLAFPVVYLISAFQAANYGLAVDEVVKTTLYFMVYWLASRLVRNENDITNLLHVIYISAIGVALAGFATATGVINIDDGFLNGRIYSTFQYPNALASFLAAVIFLGIYLWRRTASLELEELTVGKKSIDFLAWLNLNVFNRYLYAIGNFLLLTGLLGTKSQGGILVFLLVYILFIIGLPRGNRIPVFIHFVFISIPSLIAISQFLSAVALSKMGLAWLWVFAGLILAVAGQALYSFIEKKELLKWVAGHKNLVLGAVLLVVICGAIGAGVYISGNSDIIKSMAEEIRLRNATERVYFFQDAMKMFKERPIIGWGGGGWQEAYHAYQSYFYNSNQVHGHYFQIMVETGIIGILLMLGIWASFLYACHRLYHGAKDNRLLVLAITMAAVLIGLHAVIDFDLSLSALALVLWTMFGLARGVMIYSRPIVEEKKSKTYIPPNYSVLAIVSAASFIIILFAGALVSAGNLSKQAVVYLQKQNPVQVINSLQKASSYNPFTAEHHINLARIYQQQGKFDEGISEVQTALNLRKYNSQCYADLTGLMISGKKSSGDAVNAAEKALSLAPFQIQCYELLARTYFIVGYNELTGGNMDMAKDYFEKAVQVPERIQSKTDSLGETERRLWKDAPLLSLTPEINLRVGQAHYIMGMWPEAEANLNAALQDENSKGEAALWLSILKDKQGSTKEAKDLLEQAKQLVPQIAKNYEGFRNLSVFK
ncbi:O-antigen ligase family protein [Pelotomaculum propionicicum]|uniref:O-antigen ligase family protein n=1 Tax=Pelotomaculum propionicicum TaxID=258475 RepID=UPI003B7EAB00